MKRVLSAMVLVLILVGCGGSGGEGTGAPAGNPEGAASSARGSSGPDSGAPETTTKEIAGRVVGMGGKPVGGATVFTEEERATTDSDGRFKIPTRRTSEWLTVEHPGFLSRTRAAASDSPVLVRLTPDDGETVSLQFAGDVMFGRRFYDRNEDGNTADGLLQPGDGVLEHLALLDNVQPLLENADLTAVNLETPLTTNPYVIPTRPRPAKFHPTKEFVFASDPAAAVALREAGVDIVDVGNNHLYDAQERGVEDTLGALSRAGFRPGVGHFGGGRTEEEAWRAAVTSVKGQSIAFIGCTTIIAPTEPIKDAPRHISYVASDAEKKGGAAECDESTVRTKVAEARAKHDVVVVMIHGGFEYERFASEKIRQLTNIAREAGATLVINHHPHVVGGFDWNGSSLVAWTMGNLLFDQTVWPTFESYVLRVDVRRGQVIRAYAEPLMIEGFRPEGLTGGLADHAAREAAGRTPGPFVIEDGAMEVDIKGRATRRVIEAQLDGGSPAGTILDLDEGSWISDFSGAGRLQLGRDLLWAGSFEDESVDAHDLGGALWDLHGEHKRVGSEYAYEGDVGARIEREYNDRDDAALTPLHRILAKPDQEISVVGMVRTRADANAYLQLGWYPDTKGPSATKTIVPIDAASGSSWQPFRVDVTTPAEAVAIGLYLRLKPYSSQESVAADFDDVRIIEWAPAGTPFSPLYEYGRVVGAGEATVSKSFLPGGEQWANLRIPRTLPSGEVATPSVSNSGSVRKADDG